MITMPGLHHVTAIAGGAQDNVDFFAGRLGRRLVKRTVNFDAPDTYHLYYGDRTGRPGSILTFFPFADAGPGRAGPGMAQAYAYAVPPAAFSAMVDALALSGADFDGPTDRFGARVIALIDPDGAPVEFIETPDAPDDQAFHSVTLWERDPAPTLRLLTDVFGYAVSAEERQAGEERIRLVAPGTAEARMIDVIRRDDATPGRPGAGTIHHIAFRARTQEDQHHWMDALAAAGHPTTPVIDRQYFNAIYFREPGGILFEIATDPPGFATDESVDRLGKSLMLPAQHEPRRARIEQILPPLKVPA